MLRRWKDVLGTLLPTATVEKLVSIDLELLDAHRNASLRSRPSPGNAEDTKKIMRQINECVASHLAEEYTKTDYLDHCSPCFLVDKPGSSANRLVVHYGKLNKLTKRHSGTLPSLERASVCRYKSNLDKRSRFWQVKLTKRAQELMNKVLQRMKRKATMQHLLKHGAVIEVYIADVLLRADRVEDHLKLVREFLRACNQCHTKVKLNRCEFMKESLEYWGFEVGWRWWGPVKGRVTPILQATIRDDKTRGVKDVRSFLGACNFYRRHVPSFTYSSHLLTDLKKKDNKWYWGEEEAKQFQELKEKVGNIAMLETPSSEGEFVVITDASLVDRGGTLFQWQKPPEFVACTAAEELQKTLGTNRDGTPKHNHDPSCCHLIPIGHWNWKRNSTRANYSTYEREVLLGIFLLSGQGRLLGTNALVWFCDQEST